MTPRSQGPAGVGVLFHPSAFEHEAGRLHPERPERIEAILQLLDSTGLAGDLEWVEPPSADEAMLGRVHGQAHIANLRAVSAAGGGRLDQDTRMGPRSLEAALRAAGGAASAAAGLLEGRWTSALVAMRPPGHHARPDGAMGFCLLNTAAVAAAHALTSGASRVAIVDWDAHHGNGTEEIFWREGRVLYVSVHQYPFYPGTGAATDVGEGDGFGTTINIPVPAGAGPDAYLPAFDALVCPEVEGFGPDLIVVSAGYDAHQADPLCSMRLAAGDFGRLAERVAAVGRPVLYVLEGGYDLDGLAWSVAATLGAALGRGYTDLVPASERMGLEGDPAALEWIDVASSVRREVRRRVGE